MKYKKRIHWDHHRPEFLKFGFVLALAITFMAFNYTTTQPIYEPFDVEPLEADEILIPPPTSERKKVPLPPPPPKLTPEVKIEAVQKPAVIFKKEIETVDKQHLDLNLSPTFPVTETAPPVDIIVPEDPKDNPPMTQ